PAWSGVVYFFCSFSFLLSLAMLYYPPGRACSNFEPLDPFDCKEVAASLTFANVEGYADHVSRNRQTEFLGAGPKHFEIPSVRNALRLQEGTLSWLGGTAPSAGQALNAIRALPDLCLGIVSGRLGHLDPWVFSLW